MVNRIQKYTNLLTFCAAGIVLTACGPRYVPAETLLDGSGAAHSAYSQNYYQSGYSQAGYSEAQYSAPASRYGYQASKDQDGLRAPCNEIVAPCGFMRVVPIYPIYQVAIPTQPEPVAEVPTITLPEPAPVTIVEPEVFPEPVYEPVIEHWPEPAVEIPSWQPLRK